MNLPNLLTLSRILLIPVFAYVFFHGGEDRYLLALGIYLLAGVTDMLDGYLSRKLHQVTKLGIVLDPLADKLMLLGVLVCLTLGGLLPAWVLWLILLKEVLMIAGGGFLWIRKERTAVPANRYGKLGTLLFYLALSAVLLRVPEIWSMALVVGAVLLNGVAFLRYAQGFRALHGRR